MTPAEQGFLLLTAHLGNPERHPLTVPQLRNLAKRVTAQTGRTLEQRSLIADDIRALGYDSAMAEHVCSLLSETELLEFYLRRSVRAGCRALTRVSLDYPGAVRQRLGFESPGSLWAKGNLDLLKFPKISLVGSRKISRENRAFAAEAGRQAAMQGMVLVSGNAAGADQTAQNACLSAGGCVISIVADVLENKEERDNILYLSEDGFDLPFSAQRAISRNRVIHTISEVVLVAQSAFRHGGTWDGSTKNLRYHWSSVCCFNDASAAVLELEQMGANLINVTDLRNLRTLSDHNPNFLGL